MHLGILTALFLIATVTVAAADDALLGAVAAGNRHSVEQALENGADINSRAPDQATLLIIAALHDQPAIAELLVNKGADVMARNSGGFTPLHAAAYSGSLPIAKLLLEKGAALEDAANKAGVSPLMVAGEENRVAVAEFLIARGANVGHAEIHGYMPISRAFWKGNTEIVKLYRRHGATCQGPQVLGTLANVEKCMDIHD